MRNNASQNAGAHGKAQLRGACFDFRPPSFRQKISQSSEKWKPFRYRLNNCERLILVGFPYVGGPNADPICYHPGKDSQTSPVF